MEYSISVIRSKTELEITCNYINYTLLNSFWLLYTKLFMRFSFIYILFIITFSSVYKYVKLFKLLCRKE